MSAELKLDSAAAVEWCEYFHPGRAWKPSSGSAPMAYATVERDLSGTQMVGVTITDFNEIHRAAAVLVERGHGEALLDAMLDEWEKAGPPNEKCDDGPARHFQVWILRAPSDAWARAILQTVREVSK